MPVFYEGTKKVRGTANRRELSAVPKKPYWPGVDDDDEDDDDMMDFPNNGPNRNKRSNRRSDVTSSNNNNNNGSGLLTQLKGTEFEFGDVDDDGDDDGAAIAPGVPDIGGSVDRRTGRRSQRQDDIKLANDDENKAADRSSVNSPHSVGEQRKSFRTRKRKQMSSKVDEATKGSVDSKPEHNGSDQELSEPAVVTRIRVPGSSREIRKRKKPHSRQAAVTHDDEGDENVAEESLPSTPVHQDTNMNIPHDWITSWEPNNEIEVEEETSSVVDGTKSQQSVQRVSQPSPTSMNTRSKTRSTVKEMKTMTAEQNAEPTTPTKNTASTTEQPIIHPMVGQNTINTIGLLQTTAAAGNTAPLTVLPESSGILNDIFQNQLPALNDVISTIHDTLLGMVSPTLLSISREQNNSKRNVSIQHGGNLDVQSPSSHSEERNRHLEYVERLNELCGIQQESLQKVAQFKSSLLEEQSKESKASVALDDLCLQLEKARQYNATLQTQLDEKSQLNDTLQLGLEQKDSVMVVQSTTRSVLDARLEEQLQQLRKKDRTLAAKDKQVDRLREENTRLKNQVERLQSLDK